jgi:hypothetical protein
MRASPKKYGGKMYSRQLVDEGVHLELNKEEKEIVRAKLEKYFDEHVDDLNPDDDDLFIGNLIARLK